MTDLEKIAVGGVLVLAAGCVWAGVRASPGGGVRVPARASEDVNFWYEPNQPNVVGPDQHLGPVAFSPHRYPRDVGVEITTLIHRGWSSVSLPHEKDMTWLSQPPSEVSI